ncbi:glutamate racemase [Kitasatospora sp. HPMI-4]|uniref:glutamate racemase n=1 Tax=Kitasatospora sp. HPMI-4 TaxID=3448443 RepID=UPI003F1DD4BE
MNTTYLPGALPPRSRPIVIYDSGVGGLTVARHLVQLRPSEDLLYVADNGWFPYGDKRDMALRSRIYGVLDAVIESADPRAIVIACNTASTALIATLSDLATDVPVFTVTPPIEQTAKAVAGGTVVLLATPSTVRRSMVRRLVNEHSAVSRFELVGAMDLVHLAERKLAGHQVTAEEVVEALDQVIPSSRRDEVDGVILGCTHFPWLLDELRTAFPRALVWSDPARETAEQVLEQIPVRVRPTREDVARVLYLTSDHNREELRPVFARQGFWAGPSLPFSANEQLLSLQTG